MVLDQDVERVLFSEAEIVDAVDLLARRVSVAYGDRNLTVVAVLKGSCVFTADLIRRLPLRLELQFAAAESYRDGTEPGELDVRYFPDARDVRGRDVLLVDDILDSGRTLHALRARLEGLGVASVRTCVLLDKPGRRQVEIEADFRCFEVGADAFVVGYGLDHAGGYRNLPYVAELRASVLTATGTPPESRP